MAAAIVLAGTWSGPAAAAIPEHSSRPASFAHAERLREALEGRPEQQRTRGEYERVLNAYRAIYHRDPAAPKAAASIAAVGDLLAEEGRVFEDDKALHDAIGQYEFLRKQYPGSGLRFSALLTEGEIYQYDLGDRRQARALYAKFLRLYPHNALAEEARAELRKIRHEDLASERGEEGPAEKETKQRRTTPANAAEEKHEETVRHPEPEVAERKSGNSPAAVPAWTEASRVGPAESTRVDAPMVEPERVRESPAEENMTPPPPRRGRMPLITGIRYWSTPEYTRVAIDLQQEVRYEAVRVPNPGRIYFDLYGARLSPELKGQSDQVTGDTFLTRIRAAQFSDAMTRIVLDVRSVSDYSAFFLPNPPRLIIDVHGEKGGRARASATEVARAATQGPIETPIGTRTGALRQKPVFRAAVAPVNRTPAETATARTAPAVVFPDPNGESALTDVATLSQQPNQVKATPHPTTAPVAATVSETTAAEPTRRNTAAELRKPRPETPATQPANEVPPAEAGATGVPAAETGVPTSMVRALGLKINRIVIDAGHGGHDSGAIGVGGLEEKNVVLDVALRLGKLLRQRLGSDVIYTRSDDTFIPLETRTAIANQAQADLFISIHANSSSDPTVRGVETYYLNFTTSADALEVAARENSVSNESIHQLSDLVKKIALESKIDESQEFAADVDHSLYAGLDKGNPGLENRGVKKAPFVVLIGANMPSILVEISFVTNATSAADLRKAAYRERIAEALYRGVAQYVGSLNGVRVAETGEKPAASE